MQEVTFRLAKDGLRWVSANLLDGTVVQYGQPKLEILEFISSSGR